MEWTRVPGSVKHVTRGADRQDAGEPDSGVSGCRRTRGGAPVPAQGGRQVGAPLLDGPPLLAVRGCGGLRGERRGWSTPRGGRYRTNCASGPASGGPSANVSFAGRAGEGVRGDGPAGSGKSTHVSDVPAVETTAGQVIVDAQHRATATPVSCANCADAGGHGGMFQHFGLLPPRRVIDTTVGVRGRSAPAPGQRQGVPRRDRPVG